jgi:serine-type D-Ala-D-Ala carboxypeptidase (penicillin-binding protein 5/6)
MKKAFLPLLTVGFFLMGFVQAQEAIMVVEANSGKVLVARSSAEKRPISSLTKIATAVVATDWARAAGVDGNTTWITVPQTAAFLGNASSLGLQAGDRLTLRDALYASIFVEDNVAALAISNYVGAQILHTRGQNGDPNATFVNEMNILSRVLGMKNTRFVNAHGMEIKGKVNVSTATDVARLSIYAMRKAGFTFISRQKDRNVLVQGVSGTRSYQISNNNRLVGTLGITGLTTSSAGAAGSSLSISSDRDPLVMKKADGQDAVTPRRLIVVVLNQPDRFNRATSLIRQGWGVYDKWVSAGAPVQDRDREILQVNDPQ